MATDLDIAFPTLTQRHLDVLTARGHPRAVRAGDVLYAAGDTSFCFYIVLEGSIESVDGPGDKSRIVATIGPGQFTGEVTMLSNRASLVTTRVAADGRLLEFSAAELRRVVDELPELGETIIKAFLTRCDLLLSSVLEGVKIIG